MEQPEYARVAVAQTPYSAFPNAPGRLERTAGATTDIQYLVHQGFTYFGATFWVGEFSRAGTPAARNAAPTAGAEAARMGLVNYALPADQVHDPQNASPSSFW